MKVCCKIKEPVTIIRTKYNNGFTYLDIDDGDLFTGLLDKNGTKIFEGDICRHPTGYIQTITYERDAWTEDGFFTGYEFGSVTADQWEILGNVHQHPQLLETKTGDE